MNNNQNQQMPQNPNQLNWAQPADDEIDLRELWNAIWKGKWLIIAITFVFAVAGVAFALKQVNQYKSEALLAPAQAESGVGGLSAKFGGLASLAGVNLGGAGGGNKALLAQQVLQSREFIYQFIEKHQILVPLMAAKKWDLATDTLLLDEEIYNQQTKQWLREVDPPKTAQPTNWEAYEEFKNRLAVTEDKDSGFITISFEFYSPTLAKQWIDWLIADINNHIRALDTQEAQSAIEYLNGQIKQTSYADMQKIFFQLIEEQTKTIMLAEVRQEYVLKVIDPAIAPEEKSKPKRALICVLATMLGGMLGVAIVLVRMAMRKEDN